MPQVRYYAAARAAAGVEAELVDAGTVKEVLAEIASRHGDRFAHVLPICSVMVNGVAASRISDPLESSSVLDVLPPFSGG